MERSHSVETLSDAHLRCRVFGHGWDDAKDAPIIQIKDPVTRQKRWTITLNCGCGTTRTDELDTHTCEVTDRGYTYPNGYLTSFILDRADARRELVRRRIRT